MFLINTLMEDISVGTAGLVALLGYAVVFIGLIALMVVVMIMGKVMSAKKTAPAAAPAAYLHLLRQAVMGLNFHLLLCSEWMYHNN